ncbi:MAG: PD40 domain-containing protein [Actinobacteria bacterium]|nr:PD40 domain-containing protein [Actinomycetota bacterium]
MISVNNSSKSILSILFSLLLFSVVISGCSSWANQREALETKVIFSEWQIDTEKGGFKSTVSIAALGDDKKEILFGENSRIDGLKASPDGAKFAYLFDYDRLFVADIAGKNRFFVDDVVFGWPTWSPDGKRLAYVKLDYSSGNSKSTVAIYNLETGKKKIMQLGKYADLGCVVLDWYPDGESVTVFAGGESMSSSTLFEVNVDNGKTKDIAKNAQSRGFTPSGYLNVVRAVNSSDTPNSVTGGWELWQGKDGRNLKEVIKGALPSNFVTLSHDGEKLVYRKNYKKYGNQLFIADSDGNNEKRITDLDKYTELLPLWSPDDKYIVFSAVKVRDHQPGAHLYYYDTETGKVSTVIKGSKEPMNLGVIFSVYK